MDCCGECKLLAAGESISSGANTEHTVIDSPSPVRGEDGRPERQMLSQGSSQ